MIELSGYLSTYQAADSPWLAGLRAEALERARQTGVPAPRAEWWKYSSPKAALEKRWELGFEPIDPSVWAHHRLDDAALELVFANGQLVEVRGEADGVRALPIHEALRERPMAVQTYLGRYAGHVGSERIFTALNLAFMQDGVFLEVRGAPGTVHVLSVTSGERRAAHPRSLVVLAPNAEATVVETWVSGANTLSNAVTEVVLDEGARLEHVTHHAQRESTHVGRVVVQQSRDSRYCGRSFFLGTDDWCRVDTEVRLGGSGAEVDLSGLYLCGGAQHLDNHTVIRHDAPHARSVELYKGVLSGRSHAVFDGLIRIEEGASKSDAALQNHNLLLSDGAHLDTKPELEIFHDDVKASHGTTVGDLDDELLFYLCSRGIERNEARQMLARGFCADVVDTVPRAVRDAVWAAVDRRLAEVLA